MNLVNIFEKIIWCFKMILSMRWSKYHLMTNYSLKKYLRFIFTPPNSFIQWVYLIWWVISKMMMKILMINLEIIIIKTKSIQNTENDWKRYILWMLRKFTSIKLCWMIKKKFIWWILINFIHFWYSFKLNEFCENWWIDQNWIIREILHIQLIRVSIFSDFNTHFHYKQLKIKIYSKQTKLIEKEWNKWKLN